MKLQQARAFRGSGPCPDAVVTDTVGRSAMTVGLQEKAKQMRLDKVQTHQQPAFRGSGPCPDAVAPTFLSQNRQPAGMPA